MHYFYRKLKNNVITPRLIIFILYAPHDILQRCSQKVRKKILMKVTETGNAHQLMVKIQDCINKHFHENDLDIQKARGKVALLKTSKSNNIILFRYVYSNMCLFETAENINKKY